MAEQQYDLYFRGETLEGHFVDFVKADIQKLFNAKADYVEKLFSGQENLIKRQVDKATAIKFQQAFKKAGAKLIVRAHGAIPATAKAPTPARAPSTPPVQTAAATRAETAAVPAAAANRSVNAPLSASLRPADPGEGADDLVEHHQPDLKAPEQIPAWGVAEPGAQLVEAKPDVQANIDTSSLSVADTGEDLLIKSGFEEPEPVINTAAISLAEPGSDLETLDDKPAPVQVDTSHLSVDS